MDQLQAFLGSAARATLLAHFVMYPESHLHFRALERRTGLGKRSLQMELDRFVAMGLLRRDDDQTHVFYSRTKDRRWRPIETLVSHYAPALMLKQALTDIAGLDAAFVFGSIARGDAREDSDIDVLLYGDNIGERELGAALHQIALVMDRKLDVKRYDSKRLRRDARTKSGFLASALRGPMVWLRGSPDNLPVKIRSAA